VDDLQQMPHSVQSIPSKRPKCECDKTFQEKKNVNIASIAMLIFQSFSQMEAAPLGHGL